MVNQLFTKSARADVSGGATLASGSMSANKKNQQETPVNFIWGEPVHAENLRGAQV